MELTIRQKTGYALAGLSLLLFLFPQTADAHAITDLSKLSRTDVSLIYLKLTGRVV